MGKPRPRITYANVASTLALIIALGGTSYAVTTIGGEDVRNESLTGADVRNGSIGAADLAATERATGAKRKRKVKVKQGPAGAQGPQGAQGAQGPAGAAPACQGNGNGDTMVSAGPICIDRYEVSVWSSPTGGTQYGTTSDNYPCDDDGQDCGNIYARSVPGVKPSTNITWFQAQRALANVGKRLPTNAEWQQAVGGTPDTTACNISTGVMANTGATGGCISAFGANDMVGNTTEWVADWVPAVSACTSWGPAGTFNPDADAMCLAGNAPSATGPHAMIRGGDRGDGTSAGPFALNRLHPQESLQDEVGFRGAR
jgi:hypothetical protein